MSNADGRSVQKSKILKHFKSIPDSDKKKQFEDDVDACVRWDGSFSSRRKRSIEEELGQVGGKILRVLKKIHSFPGKPGFPQPGDTLQNKASSCWEKNYEENHEKSRRKENCRCCFRW